MNNRSIHPKRLPQKRFNKKNSVFLSIDLKHKIEILNHYPANNCQSDLNVPFDTSFKIPSINRKYSDKI